MVLNGTLLFIFLFLGWFISLVFFLCFSIMGNRLKQILSGFLVAVLIVLFISLCYTITNTDNRVIEEEPIETRIYNIKNITQDYVTYGSDLLNTYRIKFIDNKKYYITLHNVNNEEDQRIELNKYNYKKNWLIKGLYVKDYYTTYDLYVIEEPYNYLKVMLDTNYLLYASDNNS